MKHFALALLLLSATVFASCGSEIEDPLERDRAEMQETANGYLASVYKALKVTIRSAPATASMDSAAIEQWITEHPDDNFSKVVHVRQTVVNVISSMGLGGQSQSLSAADYAEMMTELKDLKEVLKDVDEDDFPTLLENFAYVMSALSRGTADYSSLASAWTTSEEHLVLGATMEISPGLPSAFKVYELSRINPDDLPATETRPIALMFRSIVWMQEDWLYLAEEDINSAIEMTSPGSAIRITSQVNFFPGANVSNEEDMKKELHSVCMLLRGFYRFRMDDEAKNEAAFDDFDAFLEDASSLGVNNELTQSIDAIVAVQNEDADRAVQALTQLSNSNMLGANEKESIQEAIAFLNDRDAESAMNAITDKVFIGKLVVGYAGGYLKTTSWYRDLQASAPGQRLLQFPQKVEAEYNKFGQYLDVGAWTEKGGELIDGMIE